MSKRNLILLIIILVIILISVFGFLYLQKTPTVPEDNTPGTNFVSQFNPFGNSNPKPPVTTPPVDISGYQPNPVEEAPKMKLTKISSMPVAGFAVFKKERLKEVPVLPPTTEEIPYNFGSATIKSGSAGEAVKEIQRFLNKTLNLSLELDGTLNTETITAIKQWQTGNKLVADGIVGAKTKMLMYSSVGQKMETAKPTPPPTEFATALRYVERATGNIYQTFVDKIEERKFSATVIPKVYDAYFGNHGESVVMRHLKTDDRTIETFVGNLPKELLGGDMAGNNEIKGSFLPNNVKDISVSPDSLKIFYLFDSESDLGSSAIGTVLNLSTNKKTQIFSSPFTEWLSSWGSSNIITLSTKPSATILGYVYSMDGVGKNLTKVLGGVNGLTTLMSPNGKLVLVGNNNLSLNVYHTDTKNSDVLGVKTLPEKCVWGSVSDTAYCAVPKSIPPGEYPDTWYQGGMSFSDQLWKIDIKTGNGTMLLDPATIAGGEEVDGIKLALSESEDYLFFVNKKDSSLWKLDLK